MGAYGLVFLAPIAHNWFKLLEKIFPKRQSKLGQFGSLLGKVALDQTTISPFFIGCFFVYRGLLAGSSTNDIKDNIEKNYLAVYQNSLKLWPAAQVVNFYVVPLHFRLLYLNCISLIWNTYLAGKTKFNKAAK
jgi:protein Mpv17